MMLCPYSKLDDINFAPENILCLKKNYFTRDSDIFMVGVLTFVNLIDWSSPGFCVNSLRSVKKLETMFLVPLSECVRRYDRYNKVT